MCGRFVQKTTIPELAELFGAEPRVEPGPARYNVAPTQTIAAVVERPDRARAIAPFRWGLVPHWVADTTVGSRMFNARSERIWTTPAFRTLIRSHRLIVPADGYYEWRRVGREREPYLVRSVDGSPLALAGLWAAWRDPALPADAPPLRSATIVTTGPNGLMAELHDRMPVILPAWAWDQWLDPAYGDRDVLNDLLRPAPEQLLEAVPVGRLVGNVANEGAELAIPIGPALEAVTLA
jgi:putative SOS response-associated peptidase YedK